jgi:hypothetical protein
VQVDGEDHASAVEEGAEAEDDDEEDHDHDQVIV